MTWMKQHYCPVFYLRGFTDPAAPDPKQAKLWVFWPRSGTWRRGHPRSVGWEKNFYSKISADGTADTQIENALQKVERVAAPSLAKFIERRPFDEHDVFNVCSFVATMIGRSPGRIESLSEIVTRAETKRMKLRYERLRKNPSEAAAFLTEVAAHAGRDISTDVELLNPDRVSVTANRPAVAAGSLQAAVQLVPGLLKADWLFLETREPDFFIASDNPFFFNPETTEATIPLSKDLCLVLSRPLRAERKETGKKTLQFRSTTREVVESVNARTAVGASRIIVAPSRSFPGAEHCRKRRGHSS
jgi:Protein of unknown function (DUF4238)